MGKPGGVLRTIGVGYSFKYPKTFLQANQGTLKGKSIRGTLLTGSE